MWCKFLSGEKTMTKMQNNKKHNKTKMEFSKKWLIGCIIISI